MSGVRTMHACLEAAERDVKSRVIPIRPPISSDRFAGPVYGTAHRLNPVFIEGQPMACPCCHASAWNVGRITAECAACETVLPVMRQAKGLAL
jgi:hypothetical protein